MQFPGVADTVREQYPEARATAEAHWDADAARYTVQNADVQRQLALAALRLARHGQRAPGAAGEAGLAPCALDAWAARGLLLNIGCGSGLCGDVLSARGHPWVGLDISAEMLLLAHTRGGAPRRGGCGGIGGGSSGGTSGGSSAAAGAVVLSDMGQGLPARAGAFDAAVSISAVQWLLQGPDSAARTARFFAALWACLRPPPAGAAAAATASAASSSGRGPAVAALQCYLPTEEAAATLEAAARAAGFDTALVADHPHCTAARKTFLLLFHGQRARGAAGAGAAAGPGVDLVGERECPLAFYIGGTCSAQWLGLRQAEEPGGGGSGKREQQEEEEEPSAVWQCREDAAACRFVLQHHRHHLRRLLRLVWGGVCLRGLAADCLFAACSGGGGNSSGGNDSSSSAGAARCTQCGGALARAEGDHAAHDSSSRAETSGGGDAGACTCRCVRLLVSVGSDANPCTGELLLQVVGHADGLRAIGAAPGAAPWQEPAAAAHASNGGAPRSSGSSSAAVASAPMPPPTARAARAAAAAAAAEAAAASRAVGASLCEALGPALRRAPRLAVSRPQLVGCDLWSGPDAWEHVKQQADSWERQQRAMEQQAGTGAAQSKSGGGGGSSSRGKGSKSQRRHAQIDYPLGFVPMDVEPASVAGCWVSAWSVASESFSPHPTIAVEGLAPRAAVPALGAVVEAAAAARAGVYGALLLLGRGGGACCLLIATYPLCRGTTAQASAAALVAEVSRRLG
jgi:SAM-dependent methyltransferase